jgi:membrane protein DedA with SNARE-associated domain
MCAFSVVFLSAFIAGILVGGAVVLPTAALMLDVQMLPFAVVWGAGVVGALAIIATFLAWRITSTLCRATARQR